ncbi:MAG: transcription termination factor Rho [Nocardioidaceae bacterium]|nr:transcription termination factor Rho [Nocardioidaceae bacterium]
MDSANLVHTGDSLWAKEARDIHPTWEGPHVTETPTAPLPSTVAGLQQIAGGLGIKGTGRMRKSQLIEAIASAQGQGRSSDNRVDSSADTRSRTRAAAGSDAPADNGAHRADASEAPPVAATPTEASFDHPPTQGRARDDTDHDSREVGDDGRDDRGDSPSDNRTDTRNDRADNRDRANRSDNRNDPRSDNRGDGEGTSRRRRRNRNRDRGRNDRDRNDRDRNDRGEPQVTDDDVLLPVAGILDVLDNYAFVRTSGYLPGPDDVYVSLSMVRRHGLRKGDAVTGQVKQQRDNDRKEKFNPLVRIDSVNGSDSEASRARIDFSKLTPLYAQSRLRLETESSILTTRIIDIVAPIGKGQRGLIVSPSKAGKTLVLQAMANAITTNNPECHLMVVLVDERPEEVTDMQRAVKGEVIASTFDRPAEDHTTVAELAIERAKRLVELGHDVIVLLDSITRLGRAYNLAAPASGRILSGGVDSSALYPPKRFFGAARNIEDGGSLTILATALIETGSKMDEVIFEEFKGTGNMELRLRREFADKRIFPAIDVDASGTRREELLMSREELQIVWKLRRVLSGLDGQQALELVIDKLKKTKSNVEFLMQVRDTMPVQTNGRRGGGGDDG